MPLPAGLTPVETGLPAGLSPVDDDEQPVAAGLPKGLTPVQPQTPGLGEQLKQSFVDAGRNIKKYAWDIPTEVLDRPLRPIRESLQRGGITGEMLPDIAKQNFGRFAGGAAAGLERDVAPGLLSGENAAMAGAMAANPVLGAALLSKFGGEGAKQAIAATQAPPNETPEEKGRRFAQGLGGAAMAAAPLAHVGSRFVREGVAKATEPAARLDLDAVRPEDMGAPAFDGRRAVSDLELRNKNAALLGANGQTDITSGPGLSPYAIDNLISDTAPGARGRFRDPLEERVASEASSDLVDALRRHEAAAALERFKNELPEPPPPREPVAPPEPPQQSGFVDEGVGFDPRIISDFNRWAELRTPKRGEWVKQSMDRVNGEPMFTGIDEPQKFDVSPERPLEVPDRLQSQEAISRFVAERAAQGKPTFMRVSNADIDLSKPNYRSRIQKDIPEGTHESGMSAWPLWHPDPNFDAVDPSVAGIANKASDYVHMVADGRGKRMWLLDNSDAPTLDLGYDGEPLIKQPRKLAEVSNNAAADLYETYAKGTGNQSIIDSVASTARRMREIQDAAAGHAEKPTDVEIQQAARELEKLDRAAAEAPAAAEAAGADRPVEGDGPAESTSLRAADPAARSAGSPEAGATEAGDPRDVRGQVQGDEAPAPGAGADSVGAASRYAESDNPSVLHPLPIARTLVENIQNEMKGVGSRFKDQATRNLQLTEGASPRAAELLAGAGGSEPLARKMLGGLITKAKELGITPNDAIGTLVDSNLIGMKETYQQRAAQVRAAIESGTLEDLLQDPGFQLDVARLRDKGGRDMLAQVIDKIKSVGAHGGGEGADFLLKRFEEAANQVGTDPRYAAIRQTPAYQEWLRFYKETVGDSITKFHNESGGATLKNLGPDNAWIPLQHAAGGPGEVFQKLNPFKTRTTRNNLRTGRSGDYDVSPDALAKPIASMLRGDRLDAAMDHLIKSGAIKETRPNAKTVINGVEVPMGAPDEMVFNGRVERAITEDLGNGRRLSIPESLHNELAPILEITRRSNGFWKNVANTATQIQMLGPVDPIYHGANVMAAAYRRSPVLMKGLMDAARQNPKVTNMFGAFLESLSTDPFSESNRPYLDRILEGGQVQPRWGRESYTKAGAELTGGKKWWDEVKQNPLNITHAFGPMLNGPKGLDIRLRVAFEKALDQINPDATWAERHKFTSELGDYNRATAPRMVTTAKGTGLSSFATAGMAFNNLGLKTLNPFPSLPGGGHVGLRLAQGALTSAAGHFALYTLAHIALTGQTPWDAKSDLFMIPYEKMQNTGAGQAITHSGVGHTLGIDVPGSALSANVYSLPARGMRALGLQSLYNDTVGSRQSRFVSPTTRKPKKAGDIASDMLVEAANTWAHPFMGPAAKAAIRVFGIEPSLRVDKDGSIGFRKITPKGTPSNKVIIENLKAWLIGLNPMAERFLNSAEDPKNLEPEIATKATDLLVPRLVKHPYVQHEYKK